VNLSCLLVMETLSDESKYIEAGLRLEERVESYGKSSNKLNDFFHILEKEIIPAIRN
jgi:hypothetical protein